MQKIFRVSARLLAIGGSIIFLMTSWDAFKHYALMTKVTGRVVMTEPAETSRPVVEFTVKGSDKNTIQIEPEGLEAYPPEVGMDVPVVYLKWNPNKAEVFLAANFWNEKGLAALVAVVLIGLAIGSGYAARKASKE